MDLTWYLFSFEGRINRAKLWLALLVILCWMFFLGVLVVIASPSQPVDTRPRWEQQSEIEMVPHEAGPPPVWHVKRGV